jgi:sensor histidine kinase YesM
MSRGARILSAVNRAWATPARVLSAIVGFAVLLGLVDSAQAYLRAALQGRNYTWSQAMLEGLPGWIALGLLTPFVLATARRVRLDGPRRALAVAIHFAAACAFAVAHQASVAMLSALRFDDVRFTLAMWKFLTLYFAIDLLIYGGIVGLWYAWHYARELRERELAASQLQASLSEARLEALRAQLNPHFLFNTLNAISVLALKGEREPVARTLSLLSDLLRLSLDASLPQEVPLARELQFVDRYLEIQRVRFPDRLRVERQIDDRALDALVPSLILQPLVENAVLHGVSLAPGPGEIRIGAACSDGRLVLRVHDTGPGFRLAPREGIGLRNTRARLEQLYASAQALAYGNDETGAWVRIEVPYRPSGTHVVEETRWTA